MADSDPHAGKTFVVEHLDPELEEWSSLEYYTIATECHATGAQFLLSSVPQSLKLPQNLQQAKGLHVETRGIEEIYAEKKDKVCLLDPAASKDLSPEDGDTFDIFLFGGILGTFRQYALSNRKSRNLLTPSRGRPAERCVLSYGMPCNGVQVC
jgi:ribosome biogenesis SPOUT family RNA methylase Rps3